MPGQEVIPAQIDYLVIVAEMRWTSKHGTKDDTWPALLESMYFTQNAVPPSVLYFKAALWRIRHTALYQPPSSLIHYHW